MKETLLIQTKIGNEKRSQIWSNNSPVPLGKPFRWVLERTSSGVRVRDLQRGSLVGVSHDEIRAGKSIQLVEGPQLYLKSTVPIPPAYMTGSAVEKQTEKKSMPMLFAYNGMRRSLVSCTLVHSAYVAYESGAPAYALYHHKDGFRIKTLAAGVRLKRKGEKPIVGEPGTIWEIKKEDLFKVTLFRGWHWWRFTVVTTPAALVRDTKSDEDSGLFRKLAWIFGGGMFALWALLMLFGPKETVDPLDDSGPVVKLDSRKSKVFLKTASESATAERAAPGEVAKTQSIAPAPAPVKELAPVPAPVQHRVSLADAAAKKAMQEAKNLKDTLGGLRSLGLKGVASNKGSAPAHVSKNAGIFDGPKTGSGASIALNTDVKPLMSGSQVVVQGIGGNGTGGRGTAEKGIGYSNTGVHGPVAGQGGSFVSLGDGGYKVDEGLTKEEIGAVIYGHMGEVRYCMESAMLQNPKTEGRLAIAFKIDPHGRVESAETESSSLSQSTLEDCVKTRLMTWVFPKPRGGVHVSVTYPFNFKVLERE